jgi:hypothetical protein
LPTAINLISTPARTGNWPDEVITLNEVFIDLNLVAGESGTAKQNGHRTGQCSSNNRVALLVVRTVFELTVMSEGKVEQTDTS